MDRYASGSYNLLHFHKVWGHVAWQHTFHNRYQMYRGTAYTVLTN